MDLRIAQQNICSKNDEIVELIDALLYENKKEECNEPHILYFSEFCYNKHSQNIVKRLEENDYQIFYPLAFDIKRHLNFSGICILAVKKDGYIDSFKQRERKDIALNLRYIEGRLELSNGECIEMFFTYVPQTYVPEKSFSKSEVNYYQDRVDKKANMLFNAYSFWQEYKNSQAFLGGDINIDIDNFAYYRLGWLFKKIYDETFDSEPKHQPTWGTRRLDYALVTKSLDDSKTLIINTTSDHKALMTSIITPFTKRSCDVIGSLFANGGETYTREALENILYQDLGIDNKKESNRIINGCVSKGWINECSNDTFVR